MFPMPGGIDGRLLRMARRGVNRAKKSMSAPKKLHAVSVASDYCQAFYIIVLDFVKKNTNFPAQLIAIGGTFDYIANLTSL